MINISIMGAGIAGLTAAIALKNFDRKITVDVYEKNPDVGMNHSNDFQQIENWIKRQDTLELMKSLGVDLSPCVLRNSYNMHTFSPSGRQFDLRSRTPLFYVVRRSSSGSIDDLLRQQALDKGVNIHYNSIVSELDVNIVAGGARNVQGFASGLKFRTNLRDGIYGLLDDKFAPKDYAYIVCINGEATMATVAFMHGGDTNVLREKALLRFKQMLGNFSVEEQREFCGWDAYLHASSRRLGNTLYAGAAGGFQDALFGFGIKQALISGYLAARSIHTGEDYDILWKKALGDEHRNEIVGRMFFNQLGNRGYELMIAALSFAQRLHDFDAKPFMRLAYASPLVRNWPTYKIAEFYMAHKYPYNWYLTLAHDGTCRCHHEREVLREYH